MAESTFEWVKALSPVVAALLAVAGAALVTNRVAHSLEQRRKQREFDRETMQELASLYGKIFATWKAWDTYCRFPVPQPAEETAWKLLSDAADAEGRLEAMLVRLAADRPLRDPEDIRTLAGLRQSFKIVRKAIRENKPLGWRSSRDRQYAALKAYAASTAALVSTERIGPTLSERASYRRAVGADRCAGFCMSLARGRPAADTSTAQRSREPRWLPRLWWPG
jgi:hypothetical protein